MISTNNNLKGKLSAKQSLSGKVNNKEIKIYPELEDITITPKTEQQILKSEKYGFGEVIVEAVNETIGNEELEKRIEELEAENTELKREIEPYMDFVETEIGNPILITDSSDLACEVYLFGNTIQDGEPTPNNKVEIVTVGANGNITIKVDNNLEETDENYQSYTKILPVQREFCKIGDYQDYFAKEDGKWYEYHGFKIKTLTGGFVTTGLANTFVLQSAMTDNSQTSDYGFCDYFEVNPNWAAEGGWTVLENNKMVCGRTTSHQIIIRCDDYEGNVNGFNAMLAEKQPKVYYQLQTPTKTACTTEQEEILNSFTTYRNKTNISVDVIGTIKVLYKKER